MVDVGPLRTDDTGPHGWERQGWRFWLCRHCFAPRALHPRTRFVQARPVGNHDYLSVHAPHFGRGW